MNAVSILTIYLVVAFIAHVAAKVLQYQRYVSCSLLLLHLVGLPWAIFFTRIKQEEWVNKLLLYFQLSRMPIYNRDTVQALFNLWRETHRQGPPPPRGFGQDSDERVDWLSTRQVLANYAYQKPYPQKDRQSGVAYFYQPHRPGELSGYFVTGKICLVRTGEAEYGVYTEHMTLF